MQTSNVDTEQLKALIKDKIQYKYLDGHICEPIIDDDKLILLSLIIDNTTLPEYKKKQYIITAMLVEIALKTHDLVPITNSINENDSSKTTKQLTVLAGDYFSGLYYFLLAEIEDFDMIHVLASAIKEINELKMTLYYKELSSFQDYIDTFKKIETTLIIRVAQHVNNPDVTLVIEELFIINKLNQEQRNIYTKGFTPILDYWLEHSNNHSLSSILNQIEIMIQQNTNNVKHLLTTYPIQLSIFEDYIHSTIDKIMYRKTSVAEEG